MHGFLRSRGRDVAKALFGLWLVWAPAWTAAPAIAQGSTDVVAEANRLYDQSRFEDAIKLINDAIKGGQLKADELERAREVLARSYVKAGRRVDGKDTFKAILRADPGYQPDPVRTPPDE